MDRELSPEEAREVEQHLATCAPCQARVAALEEENRALAAVLAEAESPAGVPAPAWRGAAAWTGLGVLGLGALLHATRGRVAAEVDWWGLAFDVAFFLASHAGLLGQGVGAVALATMLGLTLGGVALLRRRPAAAVIGLVALACVTGFASEARLGALQDQELEEPPVVAHRHAPLPVVVGARERVRLRPGAAGRHDRGHYPRGGTGRGI